MLATIPKVADFRNYIKEDHVFSVCTGLRPLAFGKFTTKWDHRLRRGYLDGEIISGMVMDDQIVAEWFDDVYEWRLRNLWNRDDDRTTKDDTIAGYYAELAACLALCPGHLDLWAPTLCVCTTDGSGKNVGRDLIPKWTGLILPCEVKGTRRGSATIIRRPVGMVGPSIPANMVSNSNYMLYVAYGNAVRFVGCADRALVLKSGEFNPEWLDRTAKRSGTDAMTLQRPSMNRSMDSLQ